MNTRFPRTGRRAGQSGQAIVLVALGMIGLLAFLVLAIDGGKYYDQRRTAQTAADAASLAGLYQYQHPAPSTTSQDKDILAKIVDAAGRNGIPDATNNVLAFWIQSDGQYTDGT